MSTYENYDQSCQHYDKQRAPAGADVIAAMIQFHCGAPLKDLHVLDAGCGTGNYSKALLDYGIGHVTLLDASSGMLSKAREKMAEEIDNGRVSDVVETTLPDMPFADGKFDGIMFNLVLQHLDDKSGTDYPGALATLQSARRVLRTNGVLIVTTVLPAVGSHSIWYCKICPSLTERFMRRMPTEKHFADMFERSKLSNITSLNLLGDQLLDYRNYEGPLSKTWRDATSYWTDATEEELKEIEEKIKGLKDTGRLEEWATQHDRVDTLGLLTMFVCSAI